MAGFIRTNLGRRSRAKGTTVGITINTSGLKAIRDRINGEALRDIMVEAATPMYEEARANWPVLTGASQSTIKLETVELTSKSARIVLQVGGPELVSHPDNKSRKDYAPVIEFLGSPLGRGKNTIRDAVYGNEDGYKEQVKAKVKALLEGE